MRTREYQSAYEQKKDAQTDNDWKANNTEKQLRVEKKKLVERKTPFKIQYIRKIERIVSLNGSYEFVSIGLCVVFFANKYPLFCSFCNKVIVSVSCYFVKPELKKKFRIVIN